MSKRLASAAALEQRLAAVNGEEWDSGSDEEEEAEEESTIPLPKTEPKKSKGKNKNRETDDGMSSVIYVGHIPHGFYEEQMMGFFSQFGDIEKLRLSRSKKTGGSKGFAFIDFKDVEDTKIVAESMDKYLLAGKQLVVNQLPLSQVHPSMWKGANQKFHVYPTRQQHAEKVNKEKSVDGKLRIVSSLSKNESKKRKKLESLGIDYNFPGYDALIKGAMEKTGMMEDESDDEEAEEKKEVIEEKKEVEEKKKSSKTKKTAAPTAPVVEEEEEKPKKAKKAKKSKQ